MIIPTRTKTLPQPASGDPALGPPPKPLYLMPHTGMRVDLDGPALRVSVPDQAERLFPLVRLSRVYVQGDALWATDALLACADRGVSVLFVDRHGEVLARLLGRPGLRYELHQRFVDFLERPDAEERYRLWCEAMERQAVLWVHNRLGEAEPVACVRDLRAQIEQAAIHLAGREGALRVRQWLRALAFGWMQAHLQDLGFGRDNEHGQDGRPSLATDLSDLLLWYLEPARLGWLNRRFQTAQHKAEPVRAPSRRETLALFQSRETRVGVRGRGLTNRLHRWLVEMA